MLLMLRFWEYIHSYNSADGKQELGTNDEQDPRTSASRILPGAQPSEENTICAHLHPSDKMVYRADTPDPEQLYATNQHGHYVVYMEGGYI